MKKLAIIGRGTAGCIAATHFLRYTDWYIDIYFDHSIKPLSVGEATWPGLPVDLYKNIRFTTSDLLSIDGSFKTGVSKSGWSNGNKFFHHLVPGTVAYHFNAVKLQDFIFKILQSNNRVQLIDKHIDNLNTVDSDFILDCRGRPKSFEDYNTLENIVVNSAFVTMCYWDHCRFQYSLANAKKFGWSFGIPLQNRIAIGYVYNNNFCSLDDIKEDIKETFIEYNLEPSQQTNSITFNGSYYRKENFTNRIAYSGNSSFFLEPLEATSFWIGDKIQRYAFDIWHGNIDYNSANKIYNDILNEAEVMILLHYYAGSIYDNKFWDYAKQKATACIDNAMKSEKFRNIILKSYEMNLDMTEDLKYDLYSGWGPTSYHQNLEGLGLKEKFLNMLRG
ncbi:MAG: hypothetical protein EBU90_19500 [Proteobacteria bacterium]|nr:hypothetical protein [Pseudomonadota bacterium]NBP15700.1 hypothetical protein [bacterium]